MKKKYSSVLLYFSDLCSIIINNECIRNRYRHVLITTRRGGSIESLIIIIKNRSIVRRFAQSKLHLYNNNVIVCDLLVVFIILHITSFYKVYEWPTLNTAATYDFIT